MQQQNSEFERRVENFRRLTREVRRRFFYRAALESALVSFLLAALTGAAFAGVCALNEIATPNPGTFSTAVFGIGCVATLLSIFLTKIERNAPEKAIDARYSFDDRCLTASDVLRQTERREATPIERLQLEDCFERVENVRASDVASIKPKRAKAQSFALVCALIAFAAMVWEPFASQASGGVPNETVADVLQELRDVVLPAVQELADANPDDKELKKLNDNLARWTDEIETASDDPMKATAVVARMEEALKKTIDSYDVEGAERAFKSLGEAFGEIDETTKVGEALAEGDFEKAADELEKLDFKKMSVRDRQALANKLKAAAETIRSRQDEQAAQLTEQLAEELQSGKCASCKNTSCKLAGKLRAHKSNKEKTKQLSCQMARLGLCKSNCAGACASCTQNCSSKGAQNNVKKAQPGNQNGNKSGASGGASSARPLGASQSVASDPLGGQNTQLRTNKELTQIAGKEAKEGDSTKEIIRSDDGALQDQEAQRVRDEEAREFSKQIEATLDAEEIPLERRRVVRDYFEAIRVDETSQSQPQKGENGENGSGATTSENEPQN